VLVCVGSRGPWAPFIRSSVLYALDSLGNIWKFIDQGGQKRMLMTNER